MTLPFTPALMVRELTSEHVEQARSLIHLAYSDSIYSRPMTPAELADQLLNETPPTLLPVRWRSHVVFMALRVGEPVGLLDAAVGLDGDSRGGPDHQPFGLLRFLALPADSTLRKEVGRRLLAAAYAYWRHHGVAVIKAYHPSTGYPTWQGGLGLLPSDWTDQIRLLTSEGFRYIDRFYCFVCTLRQELFEEGVPQSGLTLVFRGTSEDRRYQVFFRRTELIGEARVVRCNVEMEGRSLCVAHLVHWEVDPPWRNHNIGRWMLRRMLNDAVQQSLDQMIVFVRIHQAAAINLLAQHGFVEHPYRGYVLEKTLQA
ncbi:MAG: GNAT family N-acetyltransferase [Caldilinea sp.]|nr:GNAT family N-acetyltransferase [Caldilinea sp.]MDW8441375.1 GNAT family N-acetyltransferase [Caldilineaceae bacterium]